jgi:hypothetical protein
MSSEDKLPPVEPVEPAVVVSSDVDSVASSEAESDVESEVEPEVESEVVDVDSAVSAEEVADGS